MKRKNKPFNVDNAEDSTGFLIWQLTSVWQRSVKIELEAYDLTHSQFVVLASAHWLTLQLQDVTQIALSHHTKIDPMTISGVLKKLTHKKLITRIEHPTDTRAKTVLLTKKGQEIVKKAIATVEKFDKDFFSKLKSGLPSFNKSLVKLLDQE